jgi:hypothetical protein
LNYAGVDLMPGPLHRIGMAHPAAQSPAPAPTFYFAARYSRRADLCAYESELEQRTQRALPFSRGLVTGKGRPSERTMDLRSVRPEAQKRAGALPTYPFRPKRIPNKRRQAERDACRTTIRPEEPE